MQMRILNLCSLIGPKGTALIGHNGATLVSEDVNRDIATWLLLDRKSLSLNG